MDPNIVKLLEEDEDENIHSGADIEALTAALTRDIAGETSSDSPMKDPAALEVEPRPTHISESDSGIPLSMGLQSQVAPLVKPEEPSPEQNNINQHQMAETADNQMQQQQKPPAETGDVNVAQAADYQQQKGGEAFVQAHTASIPQQTVSATQISQGEQLNTQSILSKPEPASQQQINQAQKAKANPTVHFGAVITMLLPHLDKDRAMQLETLFTKLRKNEVMKEDFLRVVKGIVGDQMLRQAVIQLQQKQALSQSSRNPRPSQPAHSGSASSETNLVSQKVQQYSEPQKFTQMHAFTPNPLQNGPQDMKPQASTAIMSTFTATSPMQVEVTTQKTRQAAELHSDAQSVTKASPIPVSHSNQEGLSRGTLPSVSQPLQHFAYQSFSTYGSPMGSYHPHGFAAPSMNVKPSASKVAQDSQVRQIPHLVSSQPNPKPLPKYDPSASGNETKRLGGATMQQNSSIWQTPSTKELKGTGMSSVPHVKPEQQDYPPEQQHKPSMPSQGTTFSPMQIDSGKFIYGSSKDENVEKQSARTNTPASSNVHPPNPPSTLMPSHFEHAMQIRTQMPPPMPGVASSVTKAPAKKPSVGQKKPLDAVTPSQPANKKQKTSGELQDESIDQLNDVTAVSGVNLREEEEQLLSTPKEDSRDSEATRKAVQEEEERLILQKGPLQLKMAKIMAKCGIKNASADVDRCLSLSVEERLRGLILNLIRASKQRVDIEKTRHKTVVTSDIGHQIMMMNRKAKEEWEKKQAEEAEKLRKVNEAEGKTSTEMEKEENRNKALKANKEEEDKLRTNAANVAARAAVGGDDMLSKWQLMAEQAKQKRDGSSDGASAVSTSRDVDRKTSTLSVKVPGNSQNPDTVNRSPTPTASGIRSFGRQQTSLTQNKVARTITVKDVISVLEREPQMSKSPLIYRLYEMNGK